MEEIEVNLRDQLTLLGQRKLEGRTTFQGLQISIENDVGSVRQGVSDDGKKWRTVMKIPYGYIRGTQGVDGDHLDCFVGPYEDAKVAYVIHTRRPPKFTRFDEDKVMLGFHSASAAKRAFLQHYNDKRFFGGMDAIPVDEFKEKAMATKDFPTKLAAAIGLWQLAGYSAPVGEGSYGYSNMDTLVRTHPPSLKNPKRVPVDQPGETDDSYGDVTRRDTMEWLRREIAKRKGNDFAVQPVRTTDIGEQPVAVGREGVPWP